MARNSGFATGRLEGLRVSGSGTGRNVSLGEIWCALSLFGFVFALNFQKKMVSLQGCKSHPEKISDDFLWFLAAEFLQSSPGLGC